MSSTISVDSHKFLLRNVDHDEKSGPEQQKIVRTHVKKKVKSSNMVSVENELLFKLVVRNFKEFNAKPPPGKKHGKSCRQRLLEEWAEQVTGLGISTRSPEQIQEKVRKAIERCRRAIAVENENPCGLVGEHSLPLVELPYYLKPLKQALLTGVEECGLPCESNEEDNEPHFENMDMAKAMQSPNNSIFTVASIFNTPGTSNSYDAPSSTSTHANSVKNTSASEEVHVSTISPFLAGPSSASPVLKRSTSEMEADAEAEMRLSLMEAERKAAEMKKAYYAKKIELVDAQLELTILQIQQQQQRNSKSSDANNPT
ncbi:hypothetical protein RB195_002850 [Necator americanus]|uniref:Regulatory protein zeste n=1 Tax=Necator americanus TaxID=51031 RepID=A0ABR1DKY9_NECAM